MKDFIEALLTIVIVTLLEAFFVQVFWELAIPAALPGLVATGAVAKSLPFWKAMSLLMLVNSLGFSSGVNQKKKKEA